MNYKCFDCTFDTIKASLETHGVATLPRIISHDECVRLREGIWTGLRHITQGRFNLNDPTTWKSFYDLMPMHSMLLQHWGVGHMQPVWDVRQNPAIIGTFARLWETEDLLVSFDGISVHLPPEVSRRGWFRGSQWLHTDQSPTKKGLHCIQGLVNLYPVNEGDATLTFLDGSHKHHEEFFSHINQTDFKPDWFKLDEDQTTFFTNKGCKQYCVQADEGSLVLWDSRTMHSGIEPQHGRANPNYRIVIYVCMTPKRLATPAGIEKRIKAFEELRMTTHWPHLPKLFPKHPRTYGNPMPTVNDVSEPVLTYYGRKLVGYH